MSHDTERTTGALAALTTYADTTCCGIDTETLRDLITDLGHWADRNGITFESEVVHALATWWRDKQEEV